MSLFPATNVNPALDFAPPDFAKNLLFVGTH